ncbi:MAG: hypothetical protein O2895_01465 [Chloroflexi bacterium]|nr:hypothetical protein [Chloroflexota bacterium]
MGMIINANVVALDAGRKATVTSSELGKSLRHLASGTNITRATEGTDGAGRFA